MATSISNGESGLSVRNKLNNTGLSKSNLSSSSNPGASDDSSSGYQVGSRWVNVSTDEEFVCLDATGSSAIWKSTTGGLDSSEVSSLLQPNIDSNALDIATEVNARITADSNLQAQIDSNETFFKAEDAALRTSIDSNETFFKSELDTRVEGSNISGLLDSHLGSTLWRDSDTVQSDISLVANSIQVQNIVIMDSADYTALGSYDSNTVYFLR